MWTAVNLALVVFLVLANGFFVASEFALVGVRRSRIAALADGGDARAVRLLRLLDHLSAYVSATQLGITLSSLALGWIGEPAVAHLLEIPLRGRVSEPVLEAIAFAVAFSLITVLHIVLGELAPKTLALERAEKTALAIAAPMEMFYRVFQWPIRGLDWAGTSTVRLFGLHPSREHGSIYTEEELRHLIDASRQSGEVGVDEQRMINRVFDFTDAEVREAMVPRMSVKGLPITASFEETKHTVRESGFSRLPVYREQLDDIVGVLFRRDLEPFLELPSTDGFSLEALVHPPLYVPVTARLGPVLKRMQAAQTHLAFVVDEYGGVEGIVTLEDLLEEIVGEINDEFDDEVRAQIVHEGNSYLLDGMLAVRDANRKLDLNLPENGPFTTLAGFVLTQFGRLPQTGETFEYNRFRFAVAKLEGRRIRRISMEHIVESEPSE